MFNPWSSFRHHFPTFLSASAQPCQIGAPADGRTSTPGLQGAIAKTNNRNNTTIWRAAIGDVGQQSQTQKQRKQDIATYA
jgi:hypothetical protein